MCQDHIQIKALERNLLKMQFVKIKYIKKKASQSVFVSPEHSTN